MDGIRHGEGINKSGSDQYTGQWEANLAQQIRVRINIPGLKQTRGGYWYLGILRGDSGMLGEI